ncbi:MAG: hypothetical protein UX13_C0003G0006 [Candidatus Woesebacteria bacterium GW2011_GWB1_45_5]|uniref:Uncharacterized protein n=1 Tax=Candidatus Woesebacteria bacterium GW2011_GWB1_45_5 TaxID=1618581 RepID=A0A0G1MRH0_9BACT|nr:MAG: hypothetical protein UX13_C0003G0006 [Candidatus Woesebacteria bacterium GW2011_GWB1_45_5]
MDWKIVAYGGGVSLAVVALLLFFYLGLAQSLAVFVLARPFVLVAAISLLVFFLAWRSQHTAIAFLLLGATLVSIGFDFVFPPISRVCTEPNAILALSYIDEFPEAAFADDSAVCKLIIQSVGTVPLYHQSFIPPIPIYWVLVPFLVVGILALVALAEFVNPKFWAGVFLLLAYLVLAVILFTNQALGEVNITLPGLLAYGVFAPALIGLGVWVSFRAIGE